MTTGLSQSGSHQTLIAEQLSVMGGHQPQTTQSTVQALERIAGIEHFKGVLKWIATPAVDGRVDLDVPPGEHQKRGAELIDGGEQDPLNVEDWQCRQVKNALRHSWEAFVQMVRQIDRTDRKNRITGEPHQQHPFLV